MEGSTALRLLFLAVSNPEVAVALLSAVLLPLALAQTDPCSLLTAADIQTATGAKPTAGRATSTAAGGAPVAGCTWVIPSTGMVSVATTPAPTGAAREAGLARIRAAADALKAKGWAEERKDYGSAKCAVLTPPASEAKAANTAVCFSDVKGSALAVYFMDRAAKPSLDQIKALLDKAAGHL
jgi:hypothetical protein